MGKSIWCVDPETSRITLAFEGSPFWIDVKNELNIGEQRVVDTAGFKGVTSGRGTPEPGDAPEGTEIGIDWRAQSFARTEMYLVDWSLADADGNKLKVRATMRALNQAVYALIEKAITDHVEARATEKKDPSGSEMPSQT